MTSVSVFLGVLSFLCVLCVESVVQAQPQMPDPRQMAGIPRPVTDLPDGSISVRVVRGSLTNNIADQVVELRVGGKVLRAKTDAAGRAQFDRVTPGGSVRAAADVDGEQLESQEFPAPAQGGVRLLLVATAASKPESTEPNTAAGLGQVVIGSNSRIVIEPADEAIQLYYLLEIVNRAGTPVTTATPFTFDMPSDASGCGLLDGSSSLASLKGTKVSVQGPFPPGATPLQVSCGLPTTTGSLEVEQRFPATAEQLAVIVKKMGDTKVTSPQLARQQQLTTRGEAYIAATGPAVAAGQPISLSLTDLPHHSPVPRWIALFLAAAIVALAVWASARTSNAAEIRTVQRERLTTRRSRLLDELTRLEHDHRSGRVEPRRYVARREELIGLLEQIYGALDDDDTGPGPADRAGLAA